MSDHLTFTILCTPCLLNPSGTACYGRIVALLQKQLKNFDKVPAILSYYTVHKHTCLKEATSKLAGIFPPLPLKTRSSKVFQRFAGGSLREIHFLPSELALYPPAQPGSTTALTSVSAASTPDYAQSFSVLGWKIVATPHNTVLENTSTSVLPPGT